MSDQNLTKVKVREINETIQYTSWTTFHINGSGVEGVELNKFSSELDELVAIWLRNGVSVRGIYDVSGLRADADFMLWIYGDTAENVQVALQQFKRTSIGKRSTA